MSNLVWPQQVVQFKSFWIDRVNLDEDENSIHIQPYGSKKTVTVSKRELFVYTTREQGDTFARYVLNHYFTELDGKLYVNSEAS